MLLNALVPIFDILYAFVPKWFMQRYDQGWESDETQRLYKTKKTQIYQYLDLYTGPDYIVHYKFSGILNVTYVTMLYGLGLPMLFPIAFLSYFIFWATERYQIAYTYQLPPAMDDKMTVNAMKLLSYTPIMFLLNGYWMLSNMQMFDSKVSRIDQVNDRMQSGHTMDSINALSHATPMLFIAIPLLVIILLRTQIYTYLEKWGFTISQN